MTDADHRRPSVLPQHAVRLLTFLPTVYLIVGVVYIVASDFILSGFVSNGWSTVQSIKGCVFVGITSVALYWITRKALKLRGTSDAQHRDLFDENPVPMVLIDSASNGEPIIIHGNKALETLVDQTREQLIGKGISALGLAPQDVLSVLRNGGVVSTMTAVGSQRIIDLRCTPIDVDGKQARLLVLNDITSLADVQRRLQETIDALASVRMEKARSDLRMFVDTSPDLMVAFDEDRRITAYNRRFAEAYRSRAGTYPEIGERVDVSMYLPSDVARWEQGFSDAMLGRASEFELWMIDGSSRSRVIEFRFSPISAEESTVGVGCLIRDVTEQRHAQQRLEDYARRLQESLERYEIISRATHDAIWDWTVSDDTIVWNQGIARLFGYELTMTSLVWWIERLHPEDRDNVVESLRRWQESNGDEHWFAEYRFQCANGDYLWVMDRGLKYRSKDGELRRLIGSITDVHDIRQKAATIEMQNRQLREIANITSHEIRGPLASLLGLLHLYDKSDPQNPLNAQVLDYLDEAAHNLDVVIHRIVRRTFELDD
ncbi:MAG: PAS domain S-box protein [Candidatus Kapabacteria bacterium]|nr:PAS domain S-box protein [Candidatus Kapabacteria bacterium]